MKEFIIMMLVFVASIQFSAAIKSEQSHHEHAKTKDHMGFFVSMNMNKLSIISLVITGVLILPCSPKKRVQGVSEA